MFLLNKSKVKPIYSLVMYLLVTSRRFSKFFCNYKKLISYVSWNMNRLSFQNHNTLSLLIRCIECNTRCQKCVVLNAVANIALVDCVFEVLLVVLRNLYCFEMVMLLYIENFVGSSDFDPRLSSSCFQLRSFVQNINLKRKNYNNISRLTCLSITSILLYPVASHLHQFFIRDQEFPKY